MMATGPSGAASGVQRNSPGFSLTAFLRNRERREHTDSTAEGAEPEHLGD